ncbi:MFS transporter [Cohnella phaseoli]|uniref:Putative MFS family arabinose efflux permease n=1 Tax=Cohnella phaseoli TaxID=456490 RepID=A0A3D9IBI5_9BACL|nr:MFS transporter [Cohnella phaseoli]RED59128.1 putative MFS family arabinose efflux permease [Cohnella phaseoli]
MSESFRLLQNRFVRAVMLSTLFSQMGIWVRNFAILLYVMEVTGGDSFAVSMISVAEYAPIFIFSFIGGVFADRWRPKKTMVWCEVFSSLSVIFVFAVLETGTWQVIFFATLCSSILSQFAQPSGMKLFKNHVRDEDAQSCMSLLQTITSVFMVLGPILGTLAYQQFGIEVSILTTGACFMLSAIALIFVPSDPKPSKYHDTIATTLLSEMADGIRFVFANKFILQLTLCFTLVGLGVGLISPLGVFLVTEKLDLPAEALQWISIPYGVGEIVGGIVTFALATKIAPHRFLMIGLLIDGFGIILAGLSTEIWLTMTAQFIIALLQPAIFVGNSALVLQHTHQNYLGRVMGIRTPLMTGAMLLMMSIAGLLKNRLSLTIVYELAGCCFFAGFLMMIPIFRSKSGREQSSA